MQELLVVRDKVERPPGGLGVSKSMKCNIFPSLLWHCWLGDRKGIRPVKNWMLVCWWWWFGWSFARLIAPVVQLLPPPPSSFASIGTGWPRFTRKMAVKPEREKEPSFVTGATAAAFLWDAESRPQALWAQTLNTSATDTGTLALNRSNGEECLRLHSYATFSDDDDDDDDDDRTRWMTGPDVVRSSRTSSWCRALYGRTAACQHSAVTPPTPRR